MTNKIRITALLTILVVIICSLISLHIVSQIDIKPVASIKTGQGTVDTVMLKWHKVKNADGYKIYILDENNEYQLYQTVEDSDAVECIVEGLQPATVYNFKMSAYSIFNKKEYDSEISEEYVQAYTFPPAPVVTASVPRANMFSLKWENITNVTSYEIQYSLNEDLSDAASQTVEENVFTLNELKPRDTYYARCRAGFEYNGENVYSEWSDVVSAVIKQKVVMSTDVDPDKPMIAFTFDDGPNYETTSMILDVLEEYNARATFFMVGNRVSGNEEILNREISIGCELGNHTMTHKNYGSNVTVADISDASDTIYDACGQYPTMFRCPGGIITALIQRECSSEGMPLAYWSVDTKDWELKDSEKVYDNVIDNVYDGCIVLMHDIYLPTAEAVENIVPKLIEEGYQIVTVSELIYYKTGEAAQPGDQYVDSDTINNNTG